jgi:hypothetical protein
MTGKEWNAYFETLEDNYKNILRKALQLIAQDPMFKKAYGNDFAELAAIITFPLRGVKV